MRARLVTGLTIAATLSIGVGVALATFQPDVLYKPPVVKMLDHAGHDSVENMVANQDGDVLLFSSTPTQVAMDPDSDPGCDIDVSVGCPKAGIEKIVLSLGAMNDSGEIDLDGKTAEKVKQIIKGGADNDDLIGNKGTQILKGGDGKDDLEGGPGDDVLIGGPGVDNCDGGAGHDDFKDCESGHPR